MNRTHQARKFIDRLAGCEPAYIESEVCRWLVTALSGLMQVAKRLPPDTDITYLARELYHFDRAWTLVVARRLDRPSVWFKQLVAQQVQGDPDYELWRKATTYCGWSPLATYLPTSNDETKELT